MLTCQRCLGPVPPKLKSVAHLVFAPEETPELPPDHEAIGGDPQKLDLAALVEDELLLSLPLIAQHAGGRGLRAAGRRPQRSRPGEGAGDAPAIRGTEGFAETLNRR